MPKGVYKRKRKLPKLPDAKPTEESSTLVTIINNLIIRLINLRNVINGQA